MHEIEPWYYVNITKEDAANILANGIRFSSALFKFIRHVRLNI